MLSKEITPPNADHAKDNIKIMGEAQIFEEIGQKLILIEKELNDR